MQKIHTIQLHIGDLVNGTNDMSATEFGAYMRLLLKHYAIGEEGLPADDKKLARIAGLPLDKWRRIAPAVLSKFTLQGGKTYTSHRVGQELKRYLAKSTSNRDKALKRHNLDHATAEPQHSHGNAIHNPIPRIQNPESIAAIDGAVNSGDNFDRIKAAGQKKELRVATHDEVNSASKQKDFGWNPELSASVILPSGWYDMAEKRGINADRIYDSFRKFKDLTAFPFERRRWEGWIENEG